MQKNNFQHHFGKHFKAELVSTDKIEINDKEKTVLLLQELGLLAKVSAPTKTTVARLLTDDTLGDDVKTRLQKLVRISKEIQLKIDPSL